MKKISQLFLIVLFLYGCFSSKERVLSYSYNKKREATKKGYDKRKSTKADKIIATANTYRGTPYKYGGTTKRGMDCSGLVMISFLKHGISIPRTSYNMAAQGKIIALKNARKGDLIFFKTNSKKPNKITHVGLITSVKNDIVYFIHSSSKKGVIVNNTSQKYYKKNFAKIKRILQ